MENRASEATIAAAQMVHQIVSTGKEKGEIPLRVAFNQIFI